MKMNTRRYDLGQLIGVKLILLTLCLQFNLSLSAQKVHRIDPPSWWEGMASDTLELLVYGSDLSKVKSVTSEEKGIEILSWERTANDGYIYLSIALSEKSAGEYTFDFGRGKKAKAKWKVLPKPSFKPRSHTASDVMYLISPDRFANGDLENDAFSDMNETALNRNEPFGRHGGDIQGIINQLDYISNLGVTSVWSCPLLENDMKEESYHGYAITDHYEIDKRFGSNELYKQYSNELHQRNMKLVHDAVYNHCGDQHTLFLNPPSNDWFNQWEEFTQTNYRAAAFLDPHASEADKKEFQDGWFVKTMPDFNQRNPHVARYLIQNTLWWITYAEVDAIRIDTYAYPDQPFMNAAMREVNRNYPDYFLFGEIWVTGHQVQGGWTNNATLGDKASELPSVLDFQFCFGVQEMVKQDPGWANGSGRFYLTLAGDWMYEKPNDLVTFVDNHDMGRIFGEVGGDMDKFKIAMGVLLTSRGIPCFYYGTEVLMKETANHGVIREDFAGGWPLDSTNKFEAEGRSAEENMAFDYIQKLSKFRNSQPELFNGKLVQFVPKDGVYVYFQKGGGKTLMCVVNTSKEAKKINTSRFVELMPDNAHFHSILTELHLIGGQEWEVPAMKFEVLLNEG
jgi:glycosidase